VRNAGLMSAVMAVMAVVGVSRPTTTSADLMPHNRPAQASDDCAASTMRDGVAE
jgi:uncharacterized protein with FMN-binding domain